MPWGDRPRNCPPADSWGLTDAAQIAASLRLTKPALALLRQGAEAGGIVCGRSPQLERLLLAGFIEAAAPNGNGRISISTTEAGLRASCLALAGVEAQRQKGGSVYRDDGLWPASF